MKKIIDIIKNPKSEIEKLISRNMKNSSIFHRTFGFELELDHFPQSFENTFRNVLNKYEQEIGHEELPSIWTMKQDYSCGQELTSPALYSTFEEFDKLSKILNQLQKILKNQNIINDGCGFHIHVGIRDLNHLNIKKLIKIFYVYEPVLYKLQTYNRQDNHYVLSLRSNNRLKDYLYCNNLNHNLWDHYSALNFARYNTRQTIEIRYAHGTFSSINIIMWIKLILYMIELSKTTIDINFFNPKLKDLYNLITNNKIDNWLSNERQLIGRWIIYRHQQLLEKNPNLLKLEEYINDDNCVIISTKKLWNKEFDVIDEE